MKRRMLLLAVYAAMILALALPARAQERYNLGISIAANAYHERAWANIFKNDSRMWLVGTNNPVPTDALGYPRADFDIFCFDGWFAKNILKMKPYNGTYRLYFNGQADVSAPWGGVLQNKRYDEATNTTTIEYVVTEPYQTILLRFQNTRRTPASALGTGLTNLKLMRPLRIGSTQSYPPDAIFTQEYLDANNRGNVLRFMDFTATNFNVMRTWAERKVLDSMTYFDGQEEGYGWQGKGAPWEAAILLCNTLDKDAWVCIPALADDDYVRQLARLLRDTLEPERRIYVEYSNEVWNFGFAHFHQVGDLAQQEVTSNPNSPINYDGACLNSAGEFNRGLAVPRYWARRIMHISDIFRQEFGDAAMFTRVRPLFETQAAWQHWISTGLTFLDRYYNNGDGNHVANPRPINAYLWGGGGSAYNHGYPDGIVSNPNATVDDIINGYAQSWPGHYATMCRDTFWCTAFGLKRVAYEAGPGLDDHANIDSAIQTAQRDPRMKAIYKRQVDEFYKAGGDLHVHFLSVGAAHGLLPFDAIMADQPQPKREAFDELNAAEARPAPTVGFAIPSEFSAGRYHISSDGWSTGNSDDPVNLTEGYDWRSYTVRSTAPSALRILVQGTGSGTVRIEVNGRPVGTVSVASPTPVTTPELPAGVHGIRIVRVTGTPQLQSIRVAQDAVPSAPRAFRGRGGDREAILNWDAPAVGMADSYNLYRSLTPNIPPNAVPYRTGLTGNTFTDTGLRNRTNYYYRLAAVNNRGTGPMSQEIRVVPFYTRDTRNHVLNPDFESGNLNSWFGGGNNEAVRGGANGSNWAARVNGRWSSLAQTPRTLRSNTRYTLRVWARASDRSGNVRIGVRSYGGNEITRRVTSTEWIQVSISFQTGASNTSAEVMAFESNGSETTITVDDWSLTEG